MLKVLIRDIVSNIWIPIIWHWFISYSSYSKDTRKYKFNKDMPYAKDLPREILFTFCTIFISTIYEILIMVLYAKGIITNYYFDIFEHWGFFVWIVT